MGIEPRPALPIYIAALSPAMLRLAGEIADGVILWLCSPTYIRDVVIPELTTGRERAGLELEGFDVVAAVPSGVTEHREEAYGAMRGELLTYFGLPFYRAMIERSGFEGDIRDYDAAAGDLEAMKAAISDDFLGQLTAIGDDSDVLAGIERYRESGVTSPGVGPIPGGNLEATLQVVAGSESYSPT